MSIFFIIFFKGLSNSFWLKRMKEAKIFAETVRAIPILPLFFKMWQLNPYFFFQFFSESLQLKCYIWKKNSLSLSPFPSETLTQVALQDLNLQPVSHWNRINWFLTYLHTFLYRCIYLCIYVVVYIYAYTNIYHGTIMLMPLSCMVISASDKL